MFKKFDRKKAFCISFPLLVLSFIPVFTNWEVLLNNVTCAPQCPQPTSLLSKSHNWDWLHSRRVAVAINWNSARYGGGTPAYLQDLWRQAGAANTTVIGAPGLPGMAECRVETDPLAGAQSLGVVETHRALCWAEWMAATPADGYLVVAFDVALSGRRARGRDLVAPWFPVPWGAGDVAHSAAAYRAGRVAHAGADWWWWGHQQWGIEAAARALRRLTPAERAAVAAAAGREGAVLGGFSDLLYLPASRVPQFLRLARIMHEERVFVEIALPTLVAALGDARVELVGKEGWLGKAWWEVVMNAFDFGGCDDAQFDFCHRILLNQCGSKCVLERIMRS